MDGFHQLQDALAEGLGLLGVRHLWLCEATVVCDLGVSVLSLWIFVLWEGTHASWGFGRVVSDDWDEADGVGKAVWDVELLAELVGDGVVETQEGIGEGHAGESGSDVDLLTGLLRDLVDRLVKVVEDQLRGAEGDWLSVLSCKS